MAQPAAAIAIVTFASFGAGEAVGQAQTTPRSTLITEAYAAARKCFLANIHAGGIRRDAGDEAGARRYEEGARASYDAARVAALTLGYSEDRLEADIRRTREQELAPLVRDTAYFRSAVATCRTLGLMPTA